MAGDPVFLGRISELVEGKVKEVVVDGERVLLVKGEGGVYAVGATCPHAGADLSRGVVYKGFIICPWHHAFFSLEDGRAVEPPALDPIPAFDVSVVGDEVYGVRRAVETVGPSRGRGEIFLVVGLGGAGLAAVKTLRDYGFAGRIVAVSAEDELPYRRPRLTKGFLSGRLARSELYVYGREFYEKRGIELLTGRRVVRLSLGSNVAELDDGGVVEFDKVLIATGGRPRRLNVPGAGLEGIFTLRGLKDAEALRRWLRGKRRVVVVGGSFLGMEGASELARAGYDVAVVALEEEPLERVFGREVGRWLRGLAEARGVRFRMGERVAGFEGEGRVERVVLGSGEELEADAVLLAVGVEPNTEFIVGVSRRAGGKLVVDGSMRVRDGVYAAGDVTVFPYRGELVSVEHWRVAQQQGVRAALGMLGVDGVGGFVPFFWTSMFGVTVRYVGYAESWDEAVVEGGLAEGRFKVYYLRGGEVLAVAGSGVDRDIIAAELAMLSLEHPTLEDLKRFEERYGCSRA